MPRCTTGWVGAYVVSIAAALALGACSGSRGEDLGCTDISQCSAGDVCLAGFCTSTSDAKLSASASSAGADVPVLVIDALGNSCEASVCKDLPYGSQVTFRAGEAAGYRFTGWSGSPECVADGLELVIPTLTRDTNCVANYVRRIKIAGHAAGSEAGVSASSSDPFAACSANLCEVDLQGSVELTAEQRVGERFDSWSGDGCGSATSPTITIEATATDVTCIANFVPRIVVKASAMNVDAPIEVSSPGAVCELGSCILDQGGSATLRAPAVPGFRFAGWSGTAACAGGDNVLALSALDESQACLGTYMRRVTVRGSSAGAEPPPAVSAVSSDLYASCSGAACETDQNGSVTLLASSASGYRLSGWSGPQCAAQTGAAVELEDVDEDLACVANYVRGIAVIGAVVGAPGEVSASSSTPLAMCGGGGCVIDVGGDATLSAPSVPGYRFLGWDGDPGCTGADMAISFTAVSESRTCYARFATRFLVRGSPAPTEAGSVRASSSSAGATCSAESCTLDGGGEVALEAVPSAGFRFSGWSGGGACSGADSTVRVPNVVGNVTCQANFVGRLSAAAVAAPAGGGSVSAASDAGGATCVAGGCQVDQGSRVVFTALPTPGWSFTGWSQCSDSSAPVLTLESVRTDTMCQANFAPLRFTVASAVTPAGSGSVTAAATQGNPVCGDGRCTVDYDGSVSLTAVPGPGYSFAGWSGCLTSDQPTIAVSGVRADASCQATFARILLTVSGEAGPGGSVSASSSSPGSACTGASCTVPYGGDAVLTATAATGFAFGGWSGCATSAASPLTLTNITTSSSCVATFTPLRFTVTGTAAPGDGGSVVASSANPGATCAGASCSLDHGGTVGLVATPAAGFGFSGWTGCATSTSASISIADVTANASCLANFDRLTFTVQGVAGAGGLVMGAIGDAACPNAACTVAFGGSASFTALPSVGFTIAGWSGCTASSDPLLAGISGVMAPITCAVAFERINYPVDGNATGGGSISAISNTVACPNASCSVPFGGSATFTAGPDTSAGRFTGFSGACTATAADARSATVDNVAMPATCTANFDVVSYPVSGTTTGGGSITGSSAGAPCVGATCNVPFGGSATFTAGADTSAVRFTGFSGGCTARATDPRSAVVADVSAATVCTANFAPVGYTVSGTTTGGGSITGSSAGAACPGAVCSVPFGGSASFTAGPDSEALRFTGFSGACTASADDTRSALVANVSDNVTCTANFASVSYVITGSATGGGSIAGSTGGSPCSDGACSVPFGGSATFTAGPDTPAIRFTGFAGACSVIGEDPRVAVVANVAAAASCVANFSGNVYTVTGSTVGGGSITGVSGGAACAAPAICSVPFGGSATFTAGPDTEEVSFAGFTGACSVIGEDQRVATVSDVAATATCTATFTGNSYTVRGSATGGGTISATSAGAACALASCSVPVGGSATFTAEGVSSAISFAGFSGDCVASSPFALTATVADVRTDATCVANFQTAAYQVTGTAQDEIGIGIPNVVTAVSDGIACPNAVCTVPFGGSVEFTALRTSGNRVFQRFGGSCTPTAGTLTASLSNVMGAGSCTAIYAPPVAERVSLNVTVNPDSRGAGTVTCGAGTDPANNNDATTCSYVPGTLVNANAVSAQGSYFMSWSGDGCPTEGGSGGTLSFELGATVTCTALFEDEPM